MCNPRAGLPRFLTIGGLVSPKNVIKINTIGKN
jgi:hypothetical protein